MFEPLHHLRSYLLPNGLRVLLKEEHAWPLVSVQAWVRVGSIDESPREAGLAHVLEHMVFKGTHRLAASQISRTIEACGGSLNAETSKEYTHYYIDLPASGARHAVHLAAELLCRATLAPREWAHERPVILEEMKRRNDDAETMTWELLQSAVFADVAHARPVIGTPETVSSFSAATVRQFYEAHYTAENALVVIAGDFKTKEMLKWLRQEFGSMRRGKPAARRPVAVLHKAMAPRIFKKPVRQAYTAYGFVTPGADHPDQEALDLISVILGDGRNARLVHTLREEKKLVWSVGASNITQQDRGVFAIFAECDPKNRTAVAPGVRAVIAGLFKKPPTAAEVDRAKNLMQTSWLQGYETFHNQAAVIGAYALDGQLKRLDQYLPRMMALHTKDLIPVIRNYFAQELASAVVEP